MAPLVPTVAVGRAGQELWTAPRFVRHGPPQVWCAAGLVALGRTEGLRHVVDTADGTWVVRTTARREVLVTSLAGEPIARLAPSLWRRRRRGTVGDAVVQYRPSSVWRRGGRWVDDLGRVLMDVRVHDHGWRRWLVGTPTAAAGPGPWAVLLVLLADTAAYDTAPLPELLGDLAAGV